MTYTPCTYCGTLDDAAAMTAGLCSDCTTNHMAGACDARVGSCDACNALTVHTLTASGAA
jgi:NMD protein affecting ribosome stability and mRNA decay